jgi:hypothetical protein
MQGQNSVNLMYHQAEGIKHYSDVNNLNAPKDSIEKAIDICEDITKMTKKYTVKLWCCILMPIGMVIMIISGLFVPSPTKYIVIVIGLGIVVIFPIMAFVFQSKKKKQLNKLIEKFSKKTNGVINATPNYEMRTSYSKSGTRTFTVISSITLKVKQEGNYNNQAVKQNNVYQGSNYNPPNTTLPMNNTNPGTQMEHGQPMFNPTDVNGGHYSQPVNQPIEGGTNHYGYYSDVPNHMNNLNGNNPNPNLNPGMYQNNPYNNNPNMPNY